MSSVRPADDEEEPITLIDAHPAASATIATLNTRGLFSKRPRVGDVASSIRESEKLLLQTASIGAPMDDGALAVAVETPAVRQLRIMSYFLAATAGALTLLVVSISVTLGIAVGHISAIADSVVRDLPPGAINQLLLAAVATASNVNASSRIAYEALNEVRHDVYMVSSALNSTTSALQSSSTILSRFVAHPSISIGVSE